MFVFVALHAESLPTLHPTWIAKNFGVHLESFEDSFVRVLGPSHFCLAVRVTVFGCLLKAFGILREWKFVNQDRPDSAGVTLAGFVRFGAVFGLFLGWLQDGFGCLLLPGFGWFRAGFAWFGLLVLCLFGRLWSVFGWF